VYRSKVPSNELSQDPTVNKPANPVQVVAAIISTGNTILIAQRNGTQHMAGKWEFPGGKIEAGETPQQCLARELKEELSIHVSAGRYLGNNIHHYDHISIELLAFRAHWQSGYIQRTEHTDHQWVPTNRLDQYEFAPADQPFVEMLRRGEIDL